MSRQDYSLLDISDDGFVSTPRAPRRPDRARLLTRRAPQVSLMDDAGNTKDDMKLPAEDDLAKEVRGGVRLHRRVCALPACCACCRCLARRSPHTTCAASDQDRLRRGQGARGHCAEGARRAPATLHLLVLRARFGPDAARSSPGHGRGGDPRHEGGRQVGELRPPLRSSWRTRFGDQHPPSCPVLRACPSCVRWRWRIPAAQPRSARGRSATGEPYHRHTSSLASARLTSSQSPGSSQRTQPSGACCRCAPSAWPRRRCR